MLQKSRVHRLFMGVTCGALLATAGAGCGGDDPSEPTKCTADKVTGTSNKFATNGLKMPSGSGPTAYSIDIDGDNRPDNQLKNLVSTVMLASLDLQGPIDMAVAAGDAVILVDVKAADLATSSCSSVTLNLAQAPGKTDPKPKFDGTDTFKITAGMAANLYGAITGSKINTTLPKDQTPADEQKIELTLPLAGASVSLALRGAHIEGTVEMVGGQPRITKGALHGVLSKKDIDTKIVPTVATLLTDLIHKDPTSTSAKAIISLFESMTGPASVEKCKTMAKCCAKAPMTCEILPAEVLDSAVGGVLAPDVQVFDASGNWKPVAGGKTYDGMSVGLGFTAVKANY